MQEWQEEALRQGVLAIGWDWCSIDGDLILAGVESSDPHGGKLLVFCATEWRRLEGSSSKRCPVHRLVIEVLVDV